MNRARVAAGLRVVGVLGGLLAAPAVAHADEPAVAAEAAVDAAAVDTVVLQNGTTLRGRVVEVSPESHVMLRTPSGATVRIAWGDLQRVLVASHLPPAYASGTVTAAAPPPAASGPTARVHIRAPRQVFLYRKPAGTNAWTKVCASPCDRPMPIGDSYKVTGNDVAASNEFRLDARPGETVEIAVDPPSGGGMVLGGMMAYGGATVTGVGLLVALAGVSDNEEEWRNGGLITAAIGAAVGGLGFALFLNSGQTDVEQRSPHRADEARADSKATVASARMPTWRTAEVGSRTTGMPAPTFPVLLSGTF